MDQVTQNKGLWIELKWHEYNMYTMQKPNLLILKHDLEAKIELLISSNQFYLLSNLK